MRWYVEFQVTGDAAQHQELTGLAYATSGTSRRAHLRLPKRPDLPELLLHIEVKAQGVLLRRGSAGSPDVTLANRTFRELLVPWGKDAFVGPVRFCFLRSEGSGRSRGSAAYGLLMVFLSVFAGMGLWGIQQGVAWQNTLGHRPDAPSLWSNTVERCSIPEGDGFFERVLELRQRAEGKMARYPFDRSLGIEAVRLLNQASDCYTVVKESSAQNRENRLALTERANRLRARVEQDYVSLRLSLELAIGSQEARDVERLVEKLQALLVLPLNHPYERWLSKLKRDANKKTRNRTSVSPESTDNDRAQD